jgi:hypothetical protein
MQQTLKCCKQFLDYMAMHPNVSINIIHLIWFSTCIWMGHTWVHQMHEAELQGASFLAAFPTPANPSPSMAPSMSSVLCFAW